MVAIGRALIVDDDDDILRLCRASLRAYRSWQVGVAQSGEDAIEAARREPPDVILLDVMMPGKDGFVLLADLKSESATAGIPVVLMTAAAEVAAARRAHGAVGVIAKPFDPSTLPDEIERLLDAASGDARPMEAP